MSHVIILARTPREGQVYAREHSDELPRGRAIVPTSVSQITGVIPHLVIELPGFSTRPDRHAVLAAVKRSTKRYQDCEWRVIEAEGDEVFCDDCFAGMESAEHREKCVIPAEREEEAENQAALLGAFSERELVVAHRYNALRELASPTEADLEEAYAFDAEWSRGPEAFKNPTIAARFEASVEELTKNVPTDEGLLEQRKRRRTRCKDCGALHFSDDACEPTPDADEFFAGVE